MNTYPPSVLIVDDDRGILDSYGRMLQLEGYTVYKALNAHSGLLEAAAHTPDAILLDLRMPDGDGVHFLKRLRQGAGRNTPVAIVTGDYLVDESTIGDITSLGATIRLKPLWLEDIVGLVQQLIVPQSAAQRGPGGGAAA